MISIIVCSTRSEYLSKLSVNIEKSIGVDYELLTHDNKEVNWGLCRVYNSLAEKAQGDILCFLHEDVEFNTECWGKVIESFYQREKMAGVVGFAGAELKSKAISGWGTLRKYNRTHFIQQFKSGELRRFERNPYNEEFSRVVCLDGFALFVPKEIWREFPFDAEQYPGFHLYDLSFSLKIALKYHNYVCQKINVLHFSEGAFDKKWYEASMKFHELNASVLPLTVGPISQREIRFCELRNAYSTAKMVYEKKWSDYSVLWIACKLYKETSSLKYYLKFWYYVVVQKRLRR